MSDPGQTQPPGSPPPGTPPASPPAPTPPPPPSGGGGDVDALHKLNEWAKSWGAREKAEGRAAVEKQIAENLGMTLEEAKVVLDKHRESEQANLTEAEKKLLDAQKEREKARGETQIANQVVFEVLASDALVNLGLTREQAKGLIPLVKVEGSPTGESMVAAIVAAAQNVRNLYPQFFPADGSPAGGGSSNGGAPGGQGRPPDSATRGAPASPPASGSDAKERARARLRDRRGGRLRTDPQPPPEYDYTRRP